MQNELRETLSWVNKKGNQHRWTVSKLDKEMEKSIRINEDEKKKLKIKFLKLIKRVAQMYDTPNNHFGERFGVSFSCCTYSY